MNCNFTDDAVQVAALQIYKLQAQPETDLPQQQRKQDNHDNKADGRPNPSRPTPRTAGHNRKGGSTTPLPLRCAANRADQTPRQGSISPKRTASTTETGST